MTKPPQHLGSTAATRSSLPTLIVFCHLRWDFVYQRPQHLLSQLTRFYRVLVVEEPIFHDGDSYLSTYEPRPNLTVIQPHTPVQAAGFHNDQMPVLRALLDDVVPDDEDPIVWFYTPMALPLLSSCHPSLVVYDCMDELSAFKNAPRQLIERENELLGVADIVFTGGPSLYQAKRKRHSNAHCFPSSVDVTHFSKALDRTLGHSSQQGLPKPRLGFYGVIDERFDIDLLRAVAEARPEWQLVMVGPVVKIDPQSLPRSPNIHYMGQAAYEELPAYLAAWQVCLMPFALNESTKFISPTKVLEYMAAELPIVSTNITDVAQPYGDIVQIAHTPEDFIRACEGALELSSGQYQAMVGDMRAVVRSTSWKSTAESMFTLIQSAQAAKTRRPAGSLLKVPTMAMEKIMARASDAEVLSTAGNK